jgi:serine protease
MYQQQWHLKLIGMEEAWTVTKGKGAVVAVIDTGVGLPDKSQYRKPSDFADTNFTDGYDFIEKDKEPEDEQGHGTHVAATIAESTNNGLMGAGVAPEATIMPVRVLNAQGRGKGSDIDDGIYFAADHGANVINMSLGGGPYNDVEAKAMDYAYKKGVVIVCAAGNDGKGEVSYPAKYKEAIAVSAVGKDRELAYYSNYGDEIDIAGPGGDQKRDGALGGIWQNTFEEKPGGFFSGPTAQEGFFSLQGTSMASPHVAGVAALIVSLGIKNPDEVRSVLRKSAVNLGSPQMFGAGLLNAADAVKTTGAKPEQKWLTWGALAAGALIVYIMVPAGTAFSSLLTLAVGFFFPLVVEKIVGFGSIWNLAGHSVLVPLIWLLTPNLNEDASRSAAVLTFGLAIHFGLDIYSGASPFQVQPQRRVVLWFVLNLMLAVYLATFAMLSRPSHKRVAV